MKRDLTDEMRLKHLVPALWEMWVALFGLPVLRRSSKMTITHALKSELSEALRSFSHSCTEVVEAIRIQRPSFLKKKRKIRIQRAGSDHNIYSL